MNIRSIIIMSLLCGVHTISISALTWKNWSRNHDCIGTIVTPETKDELVSCVRDAVLCDKKIRVIGTGHSSNGIACCDDILIYLQKLDKIIAVDLEAKQVTVQAGITLEKLHTELAQYNLALPNLISITEPTLGGVIATASHGTGHTGTLSSFITHMELVTAAGDLLQLSIDNDISAFKAACVNLGALGVVYSITLQCESLFKLEYTRENIHIDDLVLCYKEFHEKNSFFQFRWNVKTNIAIAEFWNRVSLDTPLSSSVQYSYEALACDKGKTYGPLLCSEIAIPVQFLPEAVEVIKAFIIEWQQKGIEIRSVNGRFAEAEYNAYLSPAADYNVIFLNMATTVEDRYYEVLQDFEQRMYFLRGRPHWGKNHFLNYDSALFLYGDNLKRFIEVKHRLDPKAVFANAYTDKLFNRM